MRVLTRVAVAGALALVAAAILAMLNSGASAPRRPAAASQPIVSAGRTHHASVAPPLPPAPADVRGAAARRMAIPILMYHVVSAAPAGVPLAQLWVDQRVFAAEMSALRNAGYHAITLHQAFEAWQHGGPLPRK